MHGAAIAEAHFHFLRMRIDVDLRRIEAPQRCRDADRDQSVTLCEDADRWRYGGSWNCDGGQLGHQSACPSHFGCDGVPFDRGSDVAGN